MRVYKFYHHKRTNFYFLFFKFQAKTVHLLIHDLMDEDQEDNMEYEVSFNTFEILQINHSHNGYRCNAGKILNLLSIG